MSKTYRRKELIPKIKEIAPSLYNDESEYRIHIGYGYDHGQNFYRYIKASGFGSKWLEREIKQFYQDVGTKKSFRPLVQILNDRYRELVKKQLHQSLRHDTELQLPKHKKFDSGFWFD